MPTIADAHAAIIQSVIDERSQVGRSESLILEIRNQIRLGEIIESEVPLRIRAGAWVLLDGKVKAVVVSTFGYKVVLDVYGAIFTIPKRLLRGHIKFLGDSHA